ncbi:hypothetical protein [Kaistia algarum]|uniref:hypothetical protein n=1 Tax=Kaistia algarum TaxID=2083279 RepID=UPI001402C219|nr:hypothetical protein [Kaistia algarum]MCX5513735.1 hypothetical protein [Kaistia algarum]
MNKHLRERASYVRTFEMVETTSLRQRVEDAIEGLADILQAIDATAGAEASEAREVRSC